MTQSVNHRCIGNSTPDGDSERRRAYEWAMARYAGRAGVAQSVPQQDREEVRQYSGPATIGRNGAAQ